jgi:hypothetical protein
MDMKKSSKTKLMAAMFAAAAGLTGCDHGNSDVQVVYGPPVTENTTMTSEYDPAKDEVQDVYGPPVTEAEPTTEYKPEKDKVQLVYGPPKE